jgi:7-carboxy-7-deazaguanine synthase
VNGRYLVNEIFYSIQGEGVRAGIPHVFVRFAKCNLDCSLATMGWDCDTDFEVGEWYSLRRLLDTVEDLGRCQWVLLTGGEPGLQVDQRLIDALHSMGRQVAIETNGTQYLPDDVDWTCCSPKYAPVVLGQCDEVKYVLTVGQSPPVPPVLADHWLVSPAFKGDEPDPDAMAWCVEWVKDHSRWRLSVQNHKWLGIR